MALTKGTNAYVTVAEADAYFGDRLDSAKWTAATNPTKSQALISASGLLDNLSWVGYAVSDTQSMAFPRVGIYYDAKMGINITFDTNVPNRIVSATMELALHLLTNSGIRDDTGSVMDMSISDVTLSRIAPPSLIPPGVKKLINPMLINSGASLWWRAN